MNKFKNYSIYGLSVGSLSNICAMEALDDPNLANFVNNLKGAANDALGGLNDLGNLGNLLLDLTTALVNGDKEAGLKLLNDHIFSVPDKTNVLIVKDGVYYKFFQKVKGKNSETLFVLFHGLGQSLEEYNEKDIKTLQDKFNADVLLIEYNLNGDDNKTNTFGDMEGYCGKVANLINDYKYQNNIFFGYSLGSFVGNLTRQKFNEINKDKISSNKVTSKYIGYKGIKDLDNAGVSFIKTFTKDAKLEIITEDNICSSINEALNVKNLFTKGKSISINSFSDLFKYLLGNDEFNKIKTLTNNARILKGTSGFDKENVVFNEELKEEHGHCISLKDDIDTILRVLRDNEGKDIFLFQCNGGDEVVGEGMKKTYEAINTEGEPKDGPIDGHIDNHNTDPNGTNPPKVNQTNIQQSTQQPTTQPTDDNTKNSGCCGL